MVSEEHDRNLKWNYPFISEERKPYLTRFLSRKFPRNQTGEREVREEKGHRCRGEEEEEARKPREHLRRPAGVAGARHRLPRMAIHSHPLHCRPSLFSSSRSPFRSSPARVGFFFPSSRNNHFFHHSHGIATLSSSPPTSSLVSCFSSATASPAPSVTTIKELPGHLAKGGSWRDLLNLNSWVVRDYYRLVAAVNELEPRISALTDGELTAKTAEFRRRLGDGEILADIQAGCSSATLFVVSHLLFHLFSCLIRSGLAEAFAVVREAARRKLGMRHFDVQIIGGAVLHDGCIAEMKTGEGKTLVSTLSAYLNALTGNGVHGRHLFAVQLQVFFSSHLFLCIHRSHFLDLVMGLFLRWGG
ncbi:hypothetical protein Taro_014521 [Colocasia esculenta]|uniref:chloroplast protein-transporting ATPase n=1 Tax=Colocasia esculenta TaxID=4460 RepID=A0A843UJD8_COLES|nr:hypothetical protein [Colocasia esculenta]